LRLCTPVLPTLLLGLLALTAPACGTAVSAPDATEDATSPPPDAAPDWTLPPLPEGCRNDRTRVLHQAPWPGLGMSITLAARDDDGLPVVDLPSDALELRTLFDQPIPFTLAPAAVQRRYLLLLLADPGTLADTDRTALAGFLATLPPETEVALFRRCKHLEQVASFAPDPGRIAALLADETLHCPDDSPAAFWTSVDTATQEAAHIGGPAFPGLRTVLVVGTEPVPDPPATPAFTGLPVDLHLLYPESAAVPTTLPFPARTLAWSEGLQESLDALSGPLADQAAGLYTLGSCTDLEPETSFHLVADDGGSLCPLLTPKGPDEEIPMACDPEAIAAGQRTFPTAIEFQFTEAEKALYENYALNKIEEDFTLHVRVGDAAPVEATAHLRGQTSLDCARKSFTVNLAKNRPRHLLAGLASDEFYLISMCKDDRYFQQHTANLLARDQGLFPLRFGLVELLIDGNTRGVYLLLEKTEEGLLEDFSRVRSIIRRRFDPGEKDPDVKYPNGTDAHDPAMDAYWALVPATEGLAGQALVDEMDRRIDLDQFLRWLAFQTLMGNGDYVDELFLFSTEAVRQGGLVEWFSFMAWDMDDLYSACHHSGKHAMDDPWGLLFCAEGNLEKALLTDPVVYQRFVDILEEMMATRVTADDVDAALDETASVLLPFFERPEICQAMVVLLEKNPEAADPAIAQADILGKMDELRNQHAARRTKLEERIQAYREAQP
jgi:hypothetical protein